MASFSSISPQSTLHPSLTLAPSTRTPTLSSPLPPHTTAASIPLLSTLSAQSLITSLPSYASFSTFAAAVSDDDILALFISHVLHGTPTDTVALFHQPFLRNFPATYDSPVFFSPGTAPHTAIKSTLAGSLSSRLQLQISSDHSRLSSLLLQFSSLSPSSPSSCLPTPEEFTLESYLTALFGIYSRGADIRLEVEGGSDRRRLLVPGESERLGEGGGRGVALVFAYTAFCSALCSFFLLFFLLLLTQLSSVLDMLNHSPTSSVSHAFNSGTLSVDVLTGSSPTPPGPLLLNYGPIPNCKLLLFYGFALPGNPHDHAEVFVPLSPDLPLRARKVALMSRCHAETFSDGAPSRILPGGEIPADLLSLLRLLPVTDEGEMAAIEAAATASSGVPAVSAANELGALSALEAALQGMSQAIAVDLLEAAELEKAEGTSEVGEHCKVYAEAELQMLSECLGKVRERLEEEASKSIEDCD